jgi:exodeoxyribonuclease VII large subunit
MLRVLALNELATLLETLLRDPLLSDIWLEAEIASVSTPASGHWYFTLKDESTSIRANCWRSSAMRLMLPAVGARVRVHGRIDYYAARGEIQFIIDDIVDVGLGLAHAEFERLQRKYQGMSKQRTWPALPRRIGVVTSRSGAAWHDVQATLQARFPCVEVILAHSSVQGEYAPVEIVSALTQLYAEPVDVILVVRGGGSYEDLVAFNHEDVIQCMLRAPVPVVSGIGHEVDYTIADIVADYRAATPTMAAMAVTPDQRDIVQHVANLQATLAFHVQSRLNERSQRLDDIEARLFRAAPAQRIVAYQQRLDYSGLRLQQTIQHRISRTQETLNHLAAQLAALDPHAVLKRGFTLVRNQHGAIVRRADMLTGDEIVSIQFTDGQRTAHITEEP